MIQGGDPTGTGRGGTSIYGQRLCVRTVSFFSFTGTDPHRVCIFFFHSEDEIHPQLRFTGAGILAMANAGPNTNGGKIIPLITYSVTDHLTLILFYRLPIFHYSRPNALFRRQAHNIWTRQLWYAGRTAPWFCRR